MKVRVLPTEVHGALDYLAGAANLAFPRLLGLGDESSTVLVARVDGLAGAGYGILTDYELGAPDSAHVLR